KEVFQSSFEGVAPGTLLPARNGFVRAITKAYNEHHHLTFRPDDVWIAIMTQFSCYVNAHAEELRASFVAHEGQKHLEVEAVGTRYTVDFGYMAQVMTDLLKDNVVDPELRDWIIPKFTTTTDNDVTVAAIVMMGTLQKYFTYGMTCCCGIPSVTLLGEKHDYEEILTRLDKLCEYGEEPTTFCNMLKPVLNGFLRTFEDATASDVSDFWNNVCVHNGGSGIDYYNGWIAAFCYWNEDGKAQVNPTSLRIDTDNIPSGFIKVPVKLNDNGEKFDAEMLAGCVGMTCTSSGRTLAKRQWRRDEENDAVVGMDSLQPRQGWFMYEKGEESAPDP
ncbi:hypothetical protein BCR34DRAFT_434196, partial [Clohesyomyces aquaticus]